MQNDDVNGRVVALVVQGGKLTARQLINLMEKVLQNKDKNPKSKSKEGFLSQFKKIKVKDLVKKGKVETLELNDIDLKNLKKELKNYGVKFSVKKDLSTGNNIIFFQAKDEKVMEQAFKNTVNKFMNKDKKKESVIKRLNNFKEKVKASLDKDKVKYKHQEQSL